jgi:hypothetical protein
VSELALLLSANHPAHGNHPQNTLFYDMNPSPPPPPAADAAVTTISVVNLADTSPSAGGADATKTPAAATGITTPATRLLAKLGHTTSPRYPSPTPTRPGVAAVSLLASEGGSASGGGLAVPVALNARVSSLRLEGTRVFCRGDENFFFFFFCLFVCLFVCLFCFAVSPF